MAGVQGDSDGPQRRALLGGQETGGGLWFVMFHIICNAIATALQRGARVSNISLIDTSQSPLAVQLARLGSCYSAGKECNLLFSGSFMVSAPAAVFLCPGRLAHWAFCT